MPRTSKSSVCVVECLFKSQALFGITPCEALIITPRGGAIRFQDVDNGRALQIDRRT
jgi:hypothetical protein